MLGNAMTNRRVISNIRVLSAPGRKVIDRGCEIITILDEVRPRVTRPGIVKVHDEKINVVAAHCLSILQRTRRDNHCEWFEPANRLRHSGESRLCLLDVVPDEIAPLRPLHPAALMWFPLGRHPEAGFPGG